MTERNPSHRRGLDQIDPSTLTEVVDTGLTIVDAAGGLEGVVSAVQSTANAGQHAAQQIGSNIGQSVDTVAQHVEESVESVTPAHSTLSNIRGLDTEKENT